MVIYGRLQAEFMASKHNGHIHRYGTAVFGDIVIEVSKSIKNGNQILSEAVKI